MAKIAWPDMYCNGGKYEKIERYCSLRLRQKGTWADLNFQGTAVLPGSSLFSSGFT